MSKKVSHGTTHSITREALIEELKRCRVLKEQRHIKTYEAIDILTRIIRLLEVLIDGEAVTPERSTHHD